MKKWHIIEFEDLEAGQHREFEYRLDAKHDLITGFALFSPQFMDFISDSLDAKLSLECNNQLVFSGKAVFSLGQQTDPRKVFPEFAWLNQPYDKSFINGYIELLQNPTGNPVLVQLYILTDKQESKNG